jgi:hypothetical protein
MVAMVVLHNKESAARKGLGVREGEGETQQLNTLRL